MTDTDDDIVWETQPCSWRDIANSGYLPQVVKLRPSAGRAAAPQLGGGIDANQPLVAYSRRVRTKVYAESLVWKESKGRFVVSGKPLEIPKDYAGWFAPVNEAGDPLSPHASIAAVSDSGCERFLTQSTAVGFDCSLGDDGQLALVSEQTVYAGEILKVNEVLTRRWKIRPPAPGASPDANVTVTSRPETRFLKCTSQRQQEICLPLAHPGRFYALGSGADDRYTAVYQISELLRWGVPQIVTLVFGWAPVLAPGGRFEGALRLIGVRKPDALVLRGMGPGCRNVFVEMPIDIEVSLLRAKGVHQFDSHRAYQRALVACQKKTFPFVTNMKQTDGEYTLLPAPDAHNGEKAEAAAQPEEAQYGLRTIAVDMDDFNPLNIFPPLDIDRENVADGWTLAFGDSENTLESTGAQMRDLMVTSREEAATSRTGAAAAAAACKRRSVDLRARRESQVRAREAKC